MKTLFTFFIILLSVPTICRPQSASSVPSPTPWTVTSRSANSRVWERTTYELSPSGKITPHIHRYTELANGLCYLRNGQWLDSQNEINIMSDGSACATNGPSQAFFPPDIGSAAVRLISPEGLQIEEEPAALCYDDGSNTVFLAVVTNSIGQMIGPNKVIYPHALFGIDGDILYAYRNGGLEQDVILNERPPDPESLGLNPKTTSLKVLSQFFNPPQPTITPINVQTPAGEVADEDLEFGSIKMIPGRAFLLGTNQPSVRVTKQWMQLNGKQFLVESVPLAALSDDLITLPAATTSLSSRGKLRDLLMSMCFERHVVGKIRSRILASRTTSSISGLVLDFITVNGGLTNYTFQGDETYYISRGELTLYGTNTFEGGAVIKYTNGASILMLPTTLSDGLIWKAQPALPVIFTAKDDNSVGETISGSTGNPTGYYASGALNLIFDSDTADPISNFRIAYAGSAISSGGSYTPSFYNGQIIDCQSGFQAASPAYLENILFANVQVDFYNPFDGTLDVENCTFSSSTNLATIENAPPQNDVLAFTNCVFANILNLTNSYGSDINVNLIGSNNGFYDAPTFGAAMYTDATYPFETVGGGSYYLTNGCAFRSVGTTNIDPDLLADLAQETTWPPIVYADTNISSLGTLGPVVPRDTNSSPDLGYHYDVLDWVFGGCDLYSNLTFTAGTAVGWFQEEGGVFSDNQPYAISLNNGANLSFNGTATQPCFFANYVTVQEGESDNWTGSGYMGGIMFNGNSTGEEPQLSSDFTKWTMDSTTYNIFRDNSAYGAGAFKNSEFYNSRAGAYDMQSLYFTNCLLFRNQIDFWDQDYAISFAFENCAFYNGCFFYGRYDGDPFDDAGLSSSFWLIENCAFDGTALDWADCWDANTNHTLFNYNAYNTNNLSWQTYPFPYPPVFGTNEVVGHNDVMVTNYNWQTSWFGNFYLPSDSPLIQAGSTNANLLGLYWFTTQTNQAIEGTNIVDIGYHYVATDTNGNPLDYLDPPVPNYISYPDGPPTNYLEITTQPTNQTVMQGSNATFSVTAEGTAPLSYQWYWDGTALSDEGGVSGSGSATLTLSGVMSDQAGDYYVVVSSSFGSITSIVATLTVEPSQTYDTFPQYIMPPYAYWNVTDISDPAQPVNIGELQEPFSEPTYNFAPNDIPSVNTPWHTNTTETVTNAYGVTTSGGEFNDGTVFQIGLDGSGLTNIYTFHGYDGANPCSQLSMSGSPFYAIPTTVYGTTFSGGSSNCGTVFKVNTDGTGFTNLYDFTGGSDGKYPQTGLLISGNTLYGTTTNSIFKIATDGSDFTSLTNIIGASQLILSPSGDILYGTTPDGGTNGYGMVFNINTDGTGFTDLYAFTNDISGVSGLELYGVDNFLNGSGTTIFTLYGTTVTGGTNGCGMVFSINSDGSDFTDLHDFDETNDGAKPIGGLLITNNNVGVNSCLYGTTSTGGTNGGGTIFGMNLDGSDFQTFYSFGGTNGAQPEGKLTLTFSGQTLYGTTSGGGADTNGMVFSINNNGVDFTDLYDFSGGSDGGSPVAGLTLPVVDNLMSIWSLDTSIDVPAADVTNLTYAIAIDDYYALFVNGNLVSETHTTGGAQWSPYSPLPYLQPGENDIRVIIGGNDDANDYFAMEITGPYTNSIITNLFGTTYSGGSNKDGTVFEITSEGAITNLFNFAGTNGQYPLGDLVLSSNTLYGVTEGGGQNSAGTIFRINTDGSGYTNLYSFNGAPDDGENPYVGLTLSNNTLYGTTISGGPDYAGTIFRINTDGSGYANLYNFSNSPDGANPDAPLLLISNTLYGTTLNGGNYNGQGTIFSICTNGSGYTNLYNFGDTGGENDGDHPIGEFVLCSNTLYGVTENGGSNNDSDGTVFKFTIGCTNDVILHSFMNTPDGENPAAGITLSGNTIYGTTDAGGANGVGTIFSIGTDGTGYTILENFGGYDSNYGQNPQSDLIILGNSLYGTTYYSGTEQNGTLLDGMVFGITTNGTYFNNIHDFIGQPTDGSNPKGGLCAP